MYFSVTHTGGNTSQSWFSLLRRLIPFLTEAPSAAQLQHSTLVCAFLQGAVPLLHAVACTIHDILCNLKHTAALQLYAMLVPWRSTWCSTVSKHCIHCSKLQRRLFV